MSKFAAIDIGSNAIRLVLGVADGEGGITKVEDFREPLRLGADVFSTGELSAASMQYALDALKRLKKICDEQKADRIRAVATSALREASNASTLIKRVKAEIGVEIDVISGEEEARLIAMAVGAKLNLKSGTAILLDIGGGSVELSILERGVLVHSSSYEMGAVRVLQLLQNKKKPARNPAKFLRKHVESIRAEVLRDLGRRRADLFVGTGGNIESLGELRVSLLGKKRKSILRYTELRRLISEIEKTAEDERTRRLGLKPDRADVILPAALSVEQVFKLLRVDELQIPGVGLKNGILLEMLGAEAGKSCALAARSEQVVSYAMDLGRKYQFDETHAERVAKLALQLFDQTAALHQLNGDSRVLLELGALMHDLGHFVSRRTHHKHSQYIIRAEAFVGLTRRHKEIVGCLARYHRRGHPSMEHGEYASLAAEDRQSVLKLAALLRVADALDREHAGNVGRIKTQVEESTLVIQADSDGDLLLERWALSEKASLFEEVFGLQVRIQE